MSLRRSQRSLARAAKQHKCEKLPLKKRKQRFPEPKFPRIQVNLKLYSPTKAQRWDPLHALSTSSPNYTLLMANAWDLDEDDRRYYLMDREMDTNSEYEDSSSNIEELIPDWEDYVDPHADFKWLEQIDGKATYQQNNLSPVEEVGACRAFLVRRRFIDDTFWDDMEEPEHEMAELAFDLFDRFGCLKSEFKEHPVRRGTGVWGDELNDGDILLIEDLRVSQPYRRQGIGSKLARAVLELATKKSREFIGITSPGALQCDVEHETGASDESDEEAISKQLEDAAISFWRKLEFRRIGSSRWFGFSPDANHPSHSLAPEQDFSLPCFQKVPTTEEFDSLITDLPTIDDIECLTRLEEIFGHIAPFDCRWEATDKDGNTILHLVPCFSKVVSTQWIIQRNTSLLAQHNSDGNTPIEALEASMDRKRTIHQYFCKRTDISDLFTGYDDATVSCYILLGGRDPKQISEAELSRVKFGCTCGNCLGGFLSPRLLDKLLFNAEMAFDFLHSFGDESGGDYWCLENEDLFEYLPEIISQKIATDKDSRTGFCMLWKYLAACIRGKMLPTEENILLLVRNANEWPPHCRNFIQKGGSVSSVVTMLFKKTLDLEEYYDLENLVPDKLPTCRNDREIGMVSGMCGYERVTRVQHRTMYGRKIRY